MLKKIQTHNEEELKKEFVVSPITQGGISASKICVFLKFYLCVDKLSTKVISIYILTRVHENIYSFHNLKEVNLLSFLNIY